MQDRNREIPFYPDLIIRPPPRPPENLLPQKLESKADTSPKIDRYLVSSYFKDIYLYLAQNKLPSNKSAIRKIETLAEKYILLDSLFLTYYQVQKKRHCGISHTGDTCR